MKFERRRQGPLWSITSGSTWPAPVNRGIQTDRFGSASDTHEEPFCWLTDGRGGTPARRSASAATFPQDPSANIVENMQYPPPHRRLPARLPPVRTAT
jgi:hypothetical protein